MGNIIEAGGVLISDAGRRLETAALNIANVTTPGYKAVIPFSTYLSGADTALERQQPYELVTDLAEGQIRQTGNSLDIALHGDGLFVFAGDNGQVFGRGGQLHVDADGRLVNQSGLALQGGGGNITVSSEKIEILADGTVLDGGEPVSRIDVVRFVDPAQVTRLGTGFTTDAANIDALSQARIGQGELETSNVSSAHEMLSMMQLQRSAETGRHLVQVYDDLLGRVLSTFGQ